MATWPTTLPAPVQSGYSVAPVDPTVRSDMEVGTARVRRRTFARNDKITLAWEMSDAQLIIFRAWYELYAAEWFNTSLPAGQAGGGSTACEARFTGPYKFDYVPHLYWSVSGEVEVR